MEISSIEVGTPRIHQMAETSWGPGPRKLLLLMKKCWTTVFTKDVYTVCQRTGKFYSLKVTVKTFKDYFDFEIVILLKGEGLIGMNKEEEKTTTCYRWLIWSFGFLNTAKHISIKSIFLKSTWLNLKVRFNRAIEDKRVSHFKSAFENQKSFQCPGELGTF